MDSISTIVKVSLFQSEVRIIEKVASSLMGICSVDVKGVGIDYSGSFYSYRIIARPPIYYFVNAVDTQMEIY